MTTTEETPRYGLAIVNRYRNRGRIYGGTTMKRFDTPEQRARYAAKVQKDALEAERVTPWKSPRNRRNAPSRPVAIVAWEGEVSDGMAVARWTPARGMHLGVARVMGVRIVRTTPAVD